MKYTLARAPISIHASGELMHGERAAAASARLAAMVPTPFPVALLLAASALQPASGLDNGMGLRPPLGWSSW